MQLVSLEWWQLALLLLAGLTAGILNTLAGGGSLITLPLLLWVGLPAPVANASNRISLILQNVSGATNFHRSGHLHWRTALMLSACAIPTALIGAQVAMQVDEQWFRRILAVVLLVSVVVVARGRGDGGERSEPVNRLRLALWFVAVGFYAGFIQAGLGFALLALLHGVGQLDLVRANAVKVTIVLFAQIAALVVFTIGGTVDWVAGLVLAAGSSTGAAIAVRMQVRRGATWVRKVVLILLSVFAVVLLTQEILAWRG
ncbi:sulfite exporter TauE/SafE family protein [bacterium]|nr:MAG: sulfite exporter TauE/SafE family protein [bacterium]